MILKWIWRNERDKFCELNILRNKDTGEQPTTYNIEIRNITQRNRESESDRDRDKERKRQRQKDTETETEGCRDRYREK